MPPETTTQRSNVIFMELDSCGDPFLARGPHAPRRTQGRGTPAASRRRSKGDAEALDHRDSRSLRECLRDHTCGLRPCGGAYKTRCPWETARQQEDDALGEILLHLHESCSCRAMAHECSYSPVTKPPLFPPGIPSSSRRMPYLSLPPLPPTMHRQWDHSSMPLP